MSEIHDIDFEGVRELWNRYKLENGVILKNKPFLKRLTFIRKTGEKIEYDLEIGVSTEVDIPPKIEPSEPKSVKPVEIKIPEDIEKEMNFETISNKPQIYEAPDNTFVFISEKMDKIYLTKKFDNLGRPAYSISAGQTISIFEMKK